MHHAFLYISFLSLYDYDVKMPNFTYIVENVNADDFVFLSLNFVTLF